MKLSFLITATIGMIFLPTAASAIIFGPINKPFGGRVVSIIPCPCSANSMLVVGLPVGGTFMLDSGTKLYRNFQPTLGHWVLGLADVYTPCLQFVLIGCAPIGGGSRIRMLGTS